MHHILRYNKTNIGYEQRAKTTVYRAFASYCNLQYNKRTFKNDFLLKLNTLYHWRQLIVNSYKCMGFKYSGKASRHLRKLVLHFSSYVFKQRYAYTWNTMWIETKYSQVRIYCNFPEKLFYGRTFLAGTEQKNTTETTNVKLNSGNY